MRYHVDGSLVDADRATLPVDDPGVRFGDGVTEPLRATDGTPVAWDTHATRLFDACESLALTPGVDAATLRSRVTATLDANGLSEALVRVSVVRREDDGAGPDSSFASLQPRLDAESTVVVTAAPLSVDRSPVAVQTVRTRPIRPAAVPNAAATHNRLDAVRAHRELRRAAPPDASQAGEALLLDDGDVVGGTASDLLFVADDALRVPVPTGGDWPARTATRSVVRDLAETEGIPVVAGPATPADVRAADEAFLAEPTAGVRPVARLDGVQVGGGPATTLLARLYDERVGST